jgi:hypothetical protein
MKAKLLLAVALVGFIFVGCATTTTPEPFKCAEPGAGAVTGIGDCGVRPTTAY